MPVEGPLSCGCVMVQGRVDGQYGWVTKFDDCRAGHGGYRCGACKARWPSADRTWLTETYCMPCYEKAERRGRRRKWAADFGAPAAVLVSGVLIGLLTRRWAR